MQEKFYKVETTVSKRESFNNTILLLTMIKSEYYYIIGFSRPRGQIEIGFDYTSDIHGAITESVIVDFYSDEDNVVLSGEIKNINIEDFWESVPSNKSFYLEDSVLKYRMLAPRDQLIPISIEKMNTIVLKAKSEIFDFLEGYYRSCILKGIE